MNISEKGVSLIKEFEGLSLVPYKCPAGILTIGYGHSFRPAREVKEITREEAERFLRRDVMLVEAYINNSVKVKLTQGQFDALCSLIFNWGFGNFGKSKGLRDLNKGNYSNAAIEFFSKEKGVVKIRRKFSEGLYRRRQAELELWNEEEK